MSVGVVLYRALARWLSRPRAAFELAALVALLSLPAIAMGMVGDDYDMADAVAHDPLGAYRFSSPDPAEHARQVARGRATGARPWWTSDSHRQSFLRPVASLSHALDFALWPDAPWLMHVENSLLFAAIVLLAWGLYRQLGLSPVPLGLATFFYAFNGNQSMSVGWISGRNTLLAVAFGWLAVWLYARARSEQRSVPRWSAVVAFAGALLSAEGGVAALAYVLAHALVLEEGSLRQRLAPLWPFAAVVIVWRIAYVAGGYGVVGSAFYRDPGQDPVGVALGTLGAIPIYLATQLTIPFASMSGIRPESYLRVLVLCVVLLALLWRLLWPLVRDDRQARFLGVGSLLAILPLGTTLPQDRLVFFVGLGTAGLVAKVVHGRLAPDAPPAPRLGARTLLTLHGVVMPLLFVPVLFSSMTQFLGGGALALDRALPERADVHVVLVNGPSSLPVHFQRRMRAHRGESGIPVVDMLYAGGGNAVLRRTGTDVLEVEVDRGWLATIIEGTARDVARDPFHAGDVLELPRMRVEVVEVTERGAPRRVRFELRPTPGLERLFFTWGKTGPEPLELPAVGDELALAGISPI